MGESHQVIVLGGGAAGLAAATALASGGAGVLLLEARPRLGGRVLTVAGPADWGEEPVELGAEFVHGDAPRTTALAEKAGIEFVETEAASRWSRGGALVEAPDLERAAGEATQGAIRVGGQGDDRDDRSFADALEASGATEPGRTLALEYVQSFEAADALRLSARAFAKGDLGKDRARRVATGYGRLIEALAVRLLPGTTRMGTVVRDVRWSKGEVRVSTSDGPDGTARDDFACERLVVTLPLRPLADVRFHPGLDARREALGLVTTGLAARVSLGFREAFWRDRAPTPAFFRVPEAPFPVFWTGPRADSRVLTAWAGGPAAARLRGLDTARLTGRAIGTLGHVFGMRRGAVEGLLLGAHFHDWTEDPFSQGAYSYSLVGGADAPRSLAAPIADTLFFAGEATADAPENGTVEGALESGLRAAREVLNSLRR